MQNTISLNNTSYDKAIKVMCIKNERLLLEWLGYKFMSQSLVEHGGKYYDIITATDGAKASEFYFDVTGFYGKQPDFVFKGKDLPEPHVEFNAADFFDLNEKLDKRLFNPKVFETRLIFQIWSSEQLSMYTFLPHSVDENTIIGTPVRFYHEELDVPILHSFFFLKLYFMRKLTHIHDEFDESLTEVEIKSMSIPHIGSDCMYFKPLESFNYLNDLLNYTFYTHKPDALLNPNELEALGASLIYGQVNEMFNLEDISSALHQADIPEDLISTILSYVDLS